MYNIVLAQVHNLYSESLKVPNLLFAVNGLLHFCVLQVGNTALHVAVERGDEGLFSQLIEHEASLDVQNPVSLLTEPRARHCTHHHWLAKNSQTQESDQTDVQDISDQEIT